MSHQVNIEIEVELADDFNQLLTDTIVATLDSEGATIDCEVNVLLTDNEGIREINADLRDIDAPTDVLSFPMYEFEPGCPPDEEDEVDMETGLVPLGDMVISVERAIDQGDEYGHGTKREIAYLAVHSVLHLLGYDHMDDGPEKAKMRKREEIVLTKLNILR